MKQLIFILAILLLTKVSMAQTPPIRLHVQASKTELAGNGDDYTTIVITARDPEGEIITSMNGKVALRCSAGFLNESEIQMNNGIAFTQYTAPIFGQPIKAAQRMVYFMVKFIRKFLGRFGGSTDVVSNQKLAGNIAIETIKEGINPFTLIPKKDGDNNVYFVAEMNGIKGKTKILISKATEGGNSALLPGYYSGYDVTGQAQFELVLESGGKGQMTQGGTEAYSVLFTNEKSAEINSAMQKMMGGGEWMNAYMGASEKDMQYMEGYDVKKNGLPSIYLPMPNNGIFLYIPPILLEYKGRLVENNTGNNPKDTVVVKKEEVAFTFMQHEVIGDGRTIAKGIFHYADDNKRPISGINVKFEIPKEFKLLSAQTTTDAGGNAEIQVLVPTIKATSEERGENWKQIINNTASFDFFAFYTSPKKKNESAKTNLLVYKTVENNIRILKPGFETAPIKVLLPQSEHFKLTGNIYALVEMSNSPSIPDKLIVKDAVVMIEKNKFDPELFNRKYELYFKKERQNFISGMDVKEGGLLAITDANGNFTIKIGGGDITFKIEPLQAKISFLNAKRQKALTDVLNLFEDPAFSNQVLEKLFVMNKELCTSSHENSALVEEKLHVVGTIMTNTNGTARFMRDCAKNFSQQSYEAFKYLFFLAVEKGKWNDKLAKWAGNTATGKKLTEAGITLDKYLWNDVGGQKTQNGTYSMIYRFLFNSVEKEKVAATQEYYRLMGSTANWVLIKKEKKMMDAIAGSMSKFLEVPDMFVNMFIGMYYGDQKEEITKLLNQDLKKLDAVYEKLQPALVDRSTDIRQHYLNIASWRLNLELFKAYKDLFAELVVKGAIIIVDAATGNYASMKSHLDMLSNANKALDAAYITSRLVIEFQNYRNLWAESDAALIYANRCIEQGTLSPIVKNNDVGFSIFPSAMAAETPDANALKGVPASTTKQLSLTGGSLPVTELNKFYNGYSDFENWFILNDEKLLWLSITSPDEYSRIIKSREAYSENLENITVLALGITENPDDISLKNQWNQLAGKLAESSTQLLKDATEASEKMKEMPINPTVGDFENTNSTEIDKKWFIYGGAGLGGLLLIFGVIFIVRRRRRKSKATPAGVTAPLPYSPSAPVVSSPQRPVLPTSQPPVSAPAPHPTPKFCPQCGAPFAAGKKFCGKCGYKIPS